MTERFTGSNNQISNSPFHDFFKPYAYSVVSIKRTGLTILKFFTTLNFCFMY